jgi:hypothetical protein
LRAKLVLWLGVKLGVMENAPQPKKEYRMEWTIDQLMSIIGNKEVEIIGLRMQLAQAQKRIAEFEPKDKPKLEIVDGTA